MRFCNKGKNKIIHAIQVCYNLNDNDKDREINGLIEAMRKFYKTPYLLKLSFETFK